MESWLYPLLSDEYQYICVWFVWNPGYTLYLVMNISARHACLSTLLPPLTLARQKGALFFNYQGLYDVSVK